MKNYLRIAIVMSFISVAMVLSPVSVMALSKNHELNLSITDHGNICRGLVVDEKGNPIIGATVQVKGTTNGVLTDLDGKFQIMHVDKGSTISIKYMGYKSQEVVWNGQPIKIILKEDSKMLNEVVVVGYGAVRKADLAGSISVMNSKTLSQAPVNQLSDAFQGKVSGVQIQNSGIPGGNVLVRVRGANSVNLSNEPLVVVDGVVREDGMNGINPSDIKSIQVLKDASSTAIYGSRGSNGVILITTKVGKSGHRIVSFESQIGVSMLASRYDLLSPYGFAEAQNKLTPGKYDAATLKDLKDGKRGQDWQDVVFRKAITQNYNFTISNGNDNIQYYISGRYIDQQGILKYTGVKKYIGRVNVTSDITKNLHITTDVELHHFIKNGGHNLDAFKENVIMIAVNGDPTMEMYANKELGIFNQDSQGKNALASLALKKTEEVTNGLIANFVLRYDLMKGLSFTSTNGLDYVDLKNYGFKSKKISPVSKFASMSNDYNQHTMLQSSNNLTYMGDFDKHHLTITGVWEATASKWINIGISGNQLYNENVGWWNIALANQQNSKNGYTRSTLLSAVGRFIYSYDNRYSFTATFRADGSSKFQNKKWGVFPSVALAWDLSRENFMKNVTWINNLKIRSSYGIIGNQGISPYSTLGLLGADYTNYGLSSGLFYGFWPSAPSTPDLTWEKTHQFDIGLDCSIFNNSFGFSVDYFSKKTVDCLMSEPIPYYDGGGFYFKNVGQINNNGIDFSITANLFQKSPVRWSSTFNGTYLHNEVVNLGTNKRLFGRTPADKMADQSNITIVGEPIGSFYGYVWLGIDPKNGKNIYEDLNNDGKIDGNDRKVIGKSQPSFTIGWNNTLSYKNWDLNLFITGAFGVQRLNLVEYAVSSSLSDFPNINSVDGFNNNFDINPAHAKYASIKNGGTNYANSTQWLENANYIRLSNLSLVYTLPNKIYGVGVKFTLSGQNLLTITPYKGYDPTAAALSRANVDQTSGVDVGGYPTPRSVFIGMKLNF